jgi:hypothetical protein
MSKFSEYIDSLEGKEELDPLKIAADLHDLYTQDVTTRDAKIEELTGTIAERDSAIQLSKDEVTNWKARNFDLAMQIPSNPVNAGSVLDETDTEIDPTTVTIDDLFVK